MTAPTIGRHMAPPSIAPDADTGPASTEARCSVYCESMVDGISPRCPRHAPRAYAAFYATHREDCEPDR